MTETPVELVVEAGVATLTLNRPEVLNALSIGAIRALRDAVATVRDHADARVLLLTGRGRGFCTGADLKDPVIALDGPLEERAGKLARLMAEDINPLMAELQALPLPKLAAVNGPAVGAGIGLALAADIVLAAHSAYFQQVFTPRLGLVPDMGVTWHLPRLVGPARATAAGLLGERIPAETAAAWGMIWKALPDDELMPAARAMALQLAQAPTRAMAALSRCLTQAWGNDYPAQLALEAQEQCSLVATADAQEAVLAFRDKRQPLFQGR